MLGSDWESVYITLEQNTFVFNGQKNYLSSKHVIFDQVHNLW